MVTEPIAGTISTWDKLEKYTGHCRMTLTRWIRLEGFPRADYQVLDSRLKSVWEKAKVDAWIRENLNEKGEFIGHEKAQRQDVKEKTN